jgi:allantoate deiminase
VRFQSTYLGSKVLAGTFNPEDLKRADSDGVTMAEAIRRFGGKPEGLAEAKLETLRLLGYVEVHIEQGPVLEQRNLAVGVVTSIAGQTRKQYRFFGRAGHAGTMPMNLRADALCAAAEFVLAAEACARGTPGLVATAGEIAALPGASNVIPGEVSLILDVRHPDDTAREAACARLQEAAKDIAKKRLVEVKDSTAHQAGAVVCDRRLTAMLEQVVKRHQPEVALLPSGAGHDAAAMAAITPVAMLFVRCKGGVSHHPAESASLDDVRMAIAVMNDFLQNVTV